LFFFGWFVLLKLWFFFGIRETSEISSVSLKERNREGERSGWCVVPLSYSWNCGVLVCFG
jgi:hypothetical protein